MATSEPVSGADYLRSRATPVVGYAEHTSFHVCGALERLCATVFCGGVVDFRAHRRRVAFLVRKLLAAFLVWAKADFLPALWFFSAHRAGVLHCKRHYAAQADLECSPRLVDLSLVYLLFLTGPQRARSRSLQRATWLL